MTDPKTGGKVITLNGATIEARETEMRAIFGDTKLLSCMEAHLKNTDEPTSPEKAKSRRLEALSAFSKNPPEFWDMTDGHSGN